MEKNLVIPFEEYEIVAEINNSEPEIPSELTVYIRNKDGVITQDICLVRQHYEYNRKNENFEIDSNHVECLVWGDPNSEDYTKKYVIGIYEERE